MTSRREQIKAKAIEILKANPAGIRYTQLVSSLQEAFPDIPNNTIHGSVWDIGKSASNDIYKPERGLFRHTSFGEVPNTQETTEPMPSRIREEDFYRPFADYLQNDLEECTLAIPLGGNKFGGRWATPDVIGKYESNRSDIIKHETEIVSAEIKTDSSNLPLI